MNSGRVDDLFGLNGPGNPAGNAPLEESWALDQDPVCYSEPDGRSIPPGIAPFRPIPLAALDESLLAALGLPEAEARLAAYANALTNSPEADQLRDETISAYTALYDNLLALEESSADLAGFAEKCQALRQLIRERLAECGGQLGGRVDELVTEILAQLDTPCLPQTSAPATVSQAENESEICQPVLTCQPDQEEAKPAVLLEEPEPEEKSEAQPVEKQDLPSSPSWLASGYATSPSADRSAPEKQGEVWGTVHAISEFRQMSVRIAKELYEGAMDRITRSFRQQRPGHVERRER